MNLPDFTPASRSRGRPVRAGVQASLMISLLASVMLTVGALPAAAQEVDTTPPVLTLPEDITVTANEGNGAVVTYTTSAVDAVDGPTPVQCSIPSGTRFTLGSTEVSCTSTDSSGNLSGGFFDVVVLPQPTQQPTASADLAATLAGPATARPGSSFPVTLTVRNTGPATASRVGSGIALPVGLRVASRGGGAVTSNGRNVGFLRPTLATGQSVTYTITVTADRTTGTRTLTGATASGQTRDPRYANNATQARTTIR